MELASLEVVSSNLFLLLKLACTIQKFAVLSHINQMNLILHIEGNCARPQDQQHNKCRYFNFN